MAEIPDNFEFSRDKCHEWESWLLKAIRAFGGRATQKQIRDWLSEQQDFPAKDIPSIHETTYQQLNILVERGIIGVDKSERPQVYCLLDKPERSAR